MAYNDSGPDDWVTIPSAPSLAPSSAAGDADDWTPVRAAPLAAPRLRATAPMPPVQGLEDWVAVGNSVSAPKSEQTESVLRTAGRYATELGTSAVEGFKNLGASSLKGHAAILATAGPEQMRRQRLAINRIDAGEPVPELDDLLGYQHMLPELRAQTKADLQAYQPTKVVEHPLYRAGEAVEHFGKDALGPSPGFEGSLTRDIGSGFGSVVGGAGLAMIPGAGPYIAGSTFLSSGQGEAAERAVKAGATEEQIGQAARSGSIAGATDVVDALLPALGSTGKALGLLRRVGYAAVAGALAEGGQEGLQQLIQNAISRGIYKPEQDLLEDVPRNMLVGAIVGGGVSGGSSALSGDKPAQAPPIAAEQAAGQIAPTPIGAIDDQTAQVPPGPGTPPPGGPAPMSAPFAGSVTLSPIEQRLLTAAGIAPEAAATMSRQQIDAAIEQTVDAAGIAPAATAPLNDVAAQGAVSHETSPETPTGAVDVGPVQLEAAAPVQGVPLPTSDPVEKIDTPPPGPNRLDLQALLDDPRSADDIRADMERIRAWAPTADWQSVPQGLSVDPALEVRQLADGVTQARLPAAPGTRAAPVQLETADDVHAGAELTQTPTIAQAEAGNYRKRHIKWDRLNVSVETEQGQERTGVGADGKPWSVVMPHPYGEILGTEGADGDRLDITIGPNPQAPKVFVFDQIDPDSGAFDEHKSFQGFNTEAEARQAYEASFSDGSGYLRAGAVTEMSRPQFKTWATSGNTTKPLAYVEQNSNPVKQRAPVNRGPMSLLEFIASNGGLAPHPELRAIFDGNPLIPGRGRLLRTGGGQRLDDVRRAAVDAGYLRDTPYEGGLSTSTVRDLLDAIHAEHHGSKLYSEYDMATIADREEAKADREYQARRKEIEIDVRATIKQIGIENFTDAEVGQAIDHVLNGSDVDEAIVDVAERSAIAADQDYVASEQESTDADATARESSTGEVAEAASEQSGGAFLLAAQGGTPNRVQPAQAQYASAPAESAKAAEAADQVDASTEVVAGDGQEARIARDTDGKRFNVTLHDTTTGERIGAIKIAPSLERARFIAKSIVKATAQPDATSDPAKSTSKNPETVKPDEGAAPAAADKMSENVPPVAKPWTDDVEAKRQEYLATDGYKHSRAMEDAIDKIEVAVEADDRPGVQDAARAARKVLADIPQSERDSDPEFWKQFAGLITRMKRSRAMSRRSRKLSAKRRRRQTEMPNNSAQNSQNDSQGESGSPRAAPSEPPQTASGAKLPELALATSLRDLLAKGQPITAKILQDEAAKAYGAKLADGKFDRKDMADALELAVNMYVKETRHLRVDSPDPRHAIKMLTELLDTLPTQRVRTDEMVKFQQFSTPPNYAAAAAYVANVRAGDTVLEPSAGTGSIVAAVSAPNVKIVANELSERRAALLQDLIGADGKVFHENAEQLDNILPDSIKPTLVVMNPPFSQTAGRMGDKKDQTVAQVHIEQALNRLEPGGRLVAIVGQGMTLGAPTHRAWFKRIGEQNAIRASIGVDGKVYEKYGTTFGTRLYVIDKIAPTGEKPVTADVYTVDDLLTALEPIRDGRPEIEQRANQSSRVGAAEGSESERAGALPVSPDAGSVGSGSGSAGRLADEGSDGARQSGEPAVRVEAGQRDVLAGEQSERPGAGRAGAKPADVTAASEQPAASGSVRTERDLQSASDGQSSAATGSERIVVEAAAPGKQTKSELSESLYEHYEPRRAKVKGAKPHPGPLVESASMASVNPPPATYAPHLPGDVISKGLLSTAQLEPIIYAGQAHAKMLPTAEGDDARRRGFFIGDGTGVGKGREIAGIILDNWSQGRQKAIWVSEKKTLLQDAKRDWSGLGQNGNLLFEAGKVKAGEPIEAAKGIGFITYDTLKGGMSDQAAIAKGGFIRKQEVSVNGASGIVQRIEPGRARQPAQITVKLSGGTTVTVPANEVTATSETKVKSRVDQLVDWFGKEFDGVIAFDEAHNMGNAASSKGDRGSKDASQKAMAGLELQKRLPNARVVYVSATGATEVSNLAYADRLGLWGRGTPFASREKFINEVEQGGIAAMELIARDMKQLGLYTARNLSYDGVEYKRIEHKLDANQREIYDTLAEAWQGVLRNINEAIKITGAQKDGRAKSAAMSAFWGGHQRFFNQIVTSLQMPSVIRAVEADIKAGRQAVLQLTNTNEASQERAAAKAQTAEDIEDLDITPRDQIIQLVENSFPTQQYEEYVDENGKAQSRPVLDGDGNPVQNKQAVRMREALIDRLASIRVPQGPLDMVLDHFGIENVAEVTGRGRRFVMKPDQKTGERRRMEESRPGSSNLAETDSFQSGKKKILVFSEAGGTGRSYHADNTSGSKGNRRAHYLVQGGWRADKAVQGFGRTHRTNQASAPIVSLVTTDLQGQKRFISSIARRLSQLGALTKGQRQAGDQGIFSARDNLESVEATQALRQFYIDLNRGAVDGITINEFEEQTGLSLRKKDDEGRVSGMREDTPPITQFLNRLLSLKIDAQNAVFNAFSDRLDAVIEARSQAGLLDAGLETVKADKISKNAERTVHTVEESGAETKYVKLQLADKFEPIDFKAVAGSIARPIKFWAKSERGKIYGVTEAPSLTNADGKIVDQYRIINPVSGQRIVGQHNIDGYKTKWTRIDKAAAQDLWTAEIAAAPEFVTRDMHMITGAILPIWDRLQGSTRVVRLQTDDGERLIGRVVPRSSLAATLKNLGADGDAQKTTPASLFDHLMGGGSAQLANGWKLSRRLVAGEQRIELKGPSSHSEGAEVERDGAFSERISYEKRYFIPANAEAGTRTLERLTQYRPVTDMSDGRANTAAAEGGEDADFSVTPKGWGFAEAGAPPRMTEDEIDQVRDIVERVAGVDPWFAETIPIPKDSYGARQWGKTEDGQAQGYYSSRKDEIVIALDYGSPRAGFHEAFHRLQYRFLNEREKQVLQREVDKLRDVLRNDMARKDQVDRMSQSEIEAETFAIYATNRDLPINNILKRAWNRLLQHLQRIRNALNGLGYQTSENIFERAKSGAINGRGELAGLGDVKPLNYSDERGADGKPQLVIPGTERMSDREIARRKALAAKQSGKPQKNVDGLPLFGDSKDQGEMFSVARTPAEQAVLDRIVPSEDKKGWWRRQNFASLYTAIKDDLDPIRRLRNTLTDGAAVPAKNDPYILARLTRGSHGKAMQFLENGTFDFGTFRNTGKSLKAVLAPVKNDLDGLRAYAVAKRSLELADRGIRTGVPDLEARNTVTEGATKYQAVFEDLVAYQRSLSEYLHAAGILSDDGYAAMISANKDYVPFFRMMGEETELGHGLGSGLKTRNPVKGIRGSERQIIDPIESIIKNTFLFVSLAERNRAVTAIDNLAQTSPLGAELVSKPKPGMHPVEVTEREIAKFLTSQGVDPAAAGAMTIFRQNTFRPSPNEIAFFRDGKRQIRTVDADVAEAVNALDRESIGLITRILAAPARTLRAGAVLSPDFVARNPVRDQFSAFVFSENGYVPVYDMVRGMASLFARGEGFQSWLKSGGASASMASVDRNYINEKVIQLENPSAISRIKNVVTSPLEALRIVSELTENATRIGEHMRARARGKDEFEAGYAAREITLDFARFGAQTRAVNSIIPFWNASVEGNDRAVRAFGKRPLATSLKVAAAITLPSILLWWANHDDDRWKELPQWQRDIFWIVMTDKWEPHKVKAEGGGLRDATDEDVGSKAKRTYMRKVEGKWQVNNGTVWKIPKPFELGILFGSVPERVLDAYFTSNPNAFKKLHKTVLGAFIPNMIPQAALPFLEHATNHSFFLERSIVPKYLQDVRPKYQATPFTSETAKKIGGLIAKINDETSFSSPIVLENYIRQWGGSIGMDIVGTIDHGLRAAGLSPVKVQPAKTLNDMPVIRAFVARFPGSGQSIEEFFDEFQKRKTNTATVKHLSKLGETAAAGEEAASYPLQTAEKIQKALGVQSKVIRGIYLDKEMKPEEKRTLINNTYLQMIELAKAGNEILRASEKRP